MQLEGVRNGSSCPNGIVTVGCDAHLVEVDCTVGIFAIGNRSLQDAKWQNFASAVRPESIHTERYRDFQKQNAAHELHMNCSLDRYSMHWIRALARN